MKYLQGIISIRITYYGSNKNHVLHSYSNANFSMDLNDRKFQFQSSFLFIFSGQPMTWGSQKQDCTIRNTAKLEYIATHVATNEITWMCKLLEILDMDK
jgi:hypothetical protein